LPAHKRKVRPPDWFLIVLLGTLSLVTPFAIDMYLPAFSQVAADFGESTSRVSLSLSTYFIGFALGQIVYGPLLDRFGRKRPLYFGLTIFILASFACAHPGNLRMLIAFRLLQALGGCVAQVGSVAMVRDFFPPEQSAKVFSLVFLIIGISPLLAPTIGSIVMLWFGWPAIFLLLAALALLALSATYLLLPEGQTPDPSVSLQPRPILLGFWNIIRVPQFLTYAFAGAFSFAGLFAYVAGSPILFMEGFHVNAKAFGAIFAFVTMGFIGGNQLNVFLLRRFSSGQIFFGALRCQVVLGLAFFFGAGAGWLNVPATLVLLFVFLSCIGLTYPNAAAIALAPFTRTVGSASALLGFIQMGTGAIISTGIGVFGISAVRTLLCGTAILALAIFFVGRTFVRDEIAAVEGEPTLAH
jgi:MFS transporter, DHA1 family, multidrug resistance protein